MTDLGDPRGHLLVLTAHQSARAFGLGQSFRRLLDEEVEQHAEIAMNARVVDVELERAAIGLLGLAELAELAVDDTELLSGCGARRMAFRRAP